jgi:hypothetical protein
LWAPISFEAPRYERGASLLVEYAQPERARELDGFGAGHDGRALTVSATCRSDFPGFAFSTFAGSPLPSCLTASEITFECQRSRWLTFDTASPCSYLSGALLSGSFQRREPK